MSKFEGPQIADIVKEAIAERAFPGAVVLLARGQEIIEHSAHGSTAYQAEYSRPVTTSTLYDTASLTKLLTATALLMALDDAGLDIDVPAMTFLEELKAHGKETFTLRHLLQHSSGIELAIQDLVHSPVATWIQSIARAPLKFKPGTTVHYSCTNYFLLSRVIETIIDATLDAFITSRILVPLGMTRSTFQPLKRFTLDEIAPTEFTPEGSPWHGVVHDEAARAAAAQGVCCGNAGLFSTAGDLFRFAGLWAQDGTVKGRQLLPASVIERALADTMPENSHRRGWCWQLDAAFYMSEQAPSGSAGHAGFTGPTFLFHPKTGDTAIILNNRVHPTRHGPDRMPYHRRIATQLFNGSQSYGRA